MKKSRKILAITLALLMLLSLSACGMADLPLVKAALKLVEVNNVHIRPEGELAMRIEIPDYGMDMDVSITADGEVDYCAEPLKFAADLQVQVLGETMRVLAYGEDVKGDFVISYSTDGGASWEEKVLGKTEEINESMDSAADIDLSDIIDIGKSLGAAFSGFTKAGKEQVNGQSAARYDASFSLRKLLELKGAKEAFFQGMSEPLQVDADTLASMIDVSALEDIQFSLWLEDANARLVKGQIDMGDLMHSLIGSGLFDAILASQAGLEGVDFKADVSVMRVALTLSDFDSVGEITRPTGAAPGGEDGPGEIPSSEAGALTDSSWVGTVTIQNHAGQGSLSNGDYDVWGVIGTVGSGRNYFELYDLEDAHSTEASPVLSFWAELDGNRIIPVIDPEEQDGWFINIYLTDADESDLIFTLEDGVLSASYFYYDGEKHEACDVSFRLTPEE